MKGTGIALRLRSWWGAHRERAGEEPADFPVACLSLFPVGVETGPPLLAFSGVCATHASLVAVLLRHSPGHPDTTQE